MGSLGDSNMLLAIFSSPGLHGWAYIYLIFSFKYLLQAEWEVKMQNYVKELLEKGIC